jgi:hypothetical protein
MMIASTDIITARVGQSGARALLRALVVGALLGATALSAAAAGVGERDRDQREAREQRDQRERPQPQATQQQQAPREMREMPPQREARQFDTRAYDMRLEEARRQQAQQQQDTGARRGGRLTPDERRELRRQINEAGTELYPNTPRR